MWTGFILLFGVFGELEKYGQSITALPFSPFDFSENIWTRKYQFK